MQTEDTFTGLLLLSERKWMKSLTQTIQPLPDTVDIFSTKTYGWIVVRLSFTYVLHFQSTERSVLEIFRKLVCTAHQATPHGIPKHYTPTTATTIKSLLFNDSMHYSMSTNSNFTKQL